VVARHEDWFDESDVCSQIRVPFSVPLQGETEQSADRAPDRMTRLWQNAGDRETGAEAIEAIEAIRARRHHSEPPAERTRGRWSIIRRGR
jgi:hypothetical protein